MSDLQRRELSLQIYWNPLMLELDRHAIVVGTRDLITTMVTRSNGTHRKFSATSLRQGQDLRVRVQLEIIVGHDLHYSTYRVAAIN